MWYLCGELCPPQHEAQRAAGDHGDDGQCQQPVLLKEGLHAPLQLLLTESLEAALRSVPHAALPSQSGAIRAVFGARLLLRAR